MKKIMLCFVVLASALAQAAVKETDWATVECPDEWHPGAPLVVNVTPKAGVDEKLTINCHTHWMKAKGFGGVLKWNPPKPAAAGKKIVFNQKKLSQKPGLASLSVCVFLAPGGDYNKRVKEVKLGVKLGEPDPNAEPAYPAQPASVTFKKSSVWIEEMPEELEVGKPFTVRVRYRLDPSDTWGPKPTSLMCMACGPWIDNPDGTVNPKRRHVGLPGVGTLKKTVEPGEHTVEFTYTPKAAHRYNGGFFLLKFVAPDGTNWPWEWRGGEINLKRPVETVSLAPTALGGIFTYDETPEIEIVWGPKGASAKTAKLAVRNIAGEKVLEKAVACTPNAAQRVRIEGLKERGCFSATLDVDGVGSEYCYFATVPKFVREKGKRTRFGITNVHHPDYAKIGAKLGFSFTRLFTTWKELENAPGAWQLGRLDRTIAANADNGLLPWICLYAPPTWALPEGMHSAGFEPSPFDLKAWSNAIATLGRRYNGRLMGFEWLNEIVPGKKCKEPVSEYVAICKAGYQAAKAVNPKFVCQLAGGLWPHNYRVDCLNAGVGEWIDVLPTHYSTYDSTTVAKHDLAVRGLAGKVRVADNETASGMTVWGMTPEMTLEKSVGQCRHVMTRWPDELCAGTSFITYFGGSGDPCGNWSYLLDRVSPRPVAVTLAVVQGKLAYAKPVGKFFWEGCPVQLFEQDGKGIAFVASADGKRQDITFAGPSLTVTDFQGNVKTAKGAFAVGDMPVIVEGFDLDTLKMHAAVRVGTSEIPAAEPQVVADADAKIAVPVTVKNPFASRTTFALDASPAEWGAAKPVKVTLDPGEAKAVEVAYAVKSGAKVPPTSKLVVTARADGRASAGRPFVLYAIDPKSIGNLLANGDFEDAAPGWGGKPNVIADPADAKNHVLSFKGKGVGRWQSIWQTVDLPVPGQSYLYTCWAWGKGMGGGSNATEINSDGTKKNYMKPRVFSLGDQGCGYWHFLSKRFDTKSITTQFGVAPVCDGNGETWFDNFSLTLDRGTDYVAFAGRGQGGKRASKIPLLCENQMKAGANYTWTPESLSGVAAFDWDNEALAFRCEVTDDVSSPKALVESGDGSEAFGGDVLAIAIYPKMGADGRPEPVQERWYLSLASPGGGSGKTTLFRPKKYALGLKSGQLAKDSSVYRVDFRREGGKTVYDLRIPWSEIPGFTPAKGASFGCNLVLVDGDGKGTGRMIWGADLSEGAAGCGIVTLLP